MADRIKKSLEKIEKEEDRLSQSRCSSKSLRSLPPRLGRSEVGWVSPKVRLLREIADKLKPPKIKEDEEDRIS
jgi:hypothetical protein